MDYKSQNNGNFFSFKRVYIIATVALMLLQYLYGYFGSALVMKSTTGWGSSLLRNYLTSPRLVSGFVVFVILQIGLTTLFFWFVYWVIKKNVVYFRLKQVQHFFIGFIIWAFAILAVFFANAYYFQFSQFAFSDSLVFNLLMYIFFTSFFCLFFLFALLETAKETKLNYFGYGLVGLIFFALGIFCLKLMPRGVPKTALNSNLPNIIIIGIDSLRPDYVAALDGGLRQFPDAKKTITPTLDHILQGATVFTQNYSPLARTFPAWMSILTGEYPDQSKIYFNLVNTESMNKESLLTSQLKKLGYYTFFGMDDRRFSNIDQRFNFDAVVGPPEGANDFLLGSMNDFPWTNLLINTALGRLIFPYSYANRAAAVTYDPSTFNYLLEKKLKKIPRQPVFLAVHFCLPHWPYYWAVLPPRQGPQLKNRNLQLVYEAGVERADQQVATLWQTLQKQGLLNNAIVILLSDHGEALASFDQPLFERSKFVGDEKEKKLSKILNSDFILPAYGHGGYLTSLKENNTVLAFKFYGQEKNIPGRVEGLTSLIDIKPTLLDLLNQKSTEAQGLSLAPQIKQGLHPSLSNRSVLMQTDLSFLNIRSGKLPIKKIIAEGVNLYQINPDTGLLSIRPSVLPRLIKEKQRSILYKNWYLLIMPKFYNGSDVDAKSGVALINLKTGQWTDNLSSNFAKQAPLDLMFKRMKVVFGNNIDLDFLKQPSKNN